MSQAYQNMCAGMYKVGHRYNSASDPSSLLFFTHTAALFFLSASVSLLRPWQLWIWTGRCVSLSSSWTASRSAMSIVSPPSTAWSHRPLCTTSSSRYQNRLSDVFYLYLFFFSFYCPLSHLLSNFPALFRHLQEMSDLKKYNPPPGSADLYMAASKHFQQAKLILENVPSPDPEVRKRQLS